MSLYRPYRLSKVTSSLAIGILLIQIVALLTYFVITPLSSVPTQAAQFIELDWANHPAGSGSERIEKALVDSDDNVYIVGFFSGTVDFDPSAATDSRASAGSNDGYFSKYSSDGSYLWTRTVGGTGTDQLTDLALDSTGNIYLTGLFNGTVDFDPGPGVDSRTSVASGDAFFSKYDSDGNYVWTRTVGGNNQQNAWFVDIDSNDDVVIGFHFAATADFDPGPGTANITTLGGYDMAIGKYDSDGNYLWVGRTGTTSSDTIQKLVVGPDDKIYYSSSFDVNIDVDPGVGTTTLSRIGAHDLLINVLNSDGTHFDYIQIGGPNSTTSLIAPRDLYVHADGTIYFTGIFLNTVDFDPGTGTITHNAGSSGQNFVARFNDDLTYDWVQPLGANNAGTSSVRLAVDNAKNIYLSGYFGGTVDFDPGVDVDNLVSLGGADIYLTKYNELGSYLWAYSLGGPADQYAFELLLDNDGSILLAGSLYNNVDVDPGLGTYTITRVGAEDTFIAKYEQFSGHGVLVTETGGMTSVTEGGAADTVSVVLTSPPEADVIVDLVTDTDFSVTPVSLTFTYLDWDVPQEVTVTAIDDFQRENTETQNLSFMVSSTDNDYDGLTLSDIAVSIYDNDTPGVTITESGGSTLVSESGTTDTYNVVLNTQPSNEVVITLTSEDTDQILLSPETVTFDLNTWDVAQTVTVSAVDDNVVEADEVVDVTHTASSSDSDYHGMTIANVNVTVIDNDSVPVPSATPTPTPTPIPTPSISPPVSGFDFELVSIGPVNYDINYTTYYFNGTNLYFLGIGTSNSEVTVYIEGDDYGSTFIDDEGNWVIAPTLSAGTYNVVIESVLGEQSASVSFVLILNQDVLPAENPTPTATVGPTSEPAATPSSQSTPTVSEPAPSATPIILVTFDDDVPRRGLGDLARRILENIPAVQAYAEVLVETLEQQTQSPVSAAATSSLVVTSSIAPWVPLVVTKLTTTLRFAQIWHIPGLLFGLLKRKRKPWGVVYDVDTKQPLDPVLVTLRDDTGNEVKQAVTDMFGRYHFLVPPGRYRLEVDKSNYIFAPGKLDGDLSGGVYEDVYMGQMFEVHTNEDVKFNIPMLAENRDWNEEFKQQSGAYRAARGGTTVYVISSVLFYLTLIWSIVAVLLSPILLNVIILALAIVINFIRIYTLKNRSWGIIKADVGPLAGIVIRLHNINVPEMRYPAVVTDRLGRYNILVESGQYAIGVELQKPDGSFEEKYRSQTIEIREQFGHIAQDVTLDLA